MINLVENEKVFNAAQQYRWASSTNPEEVLEAYHTMLRVIVAAVSCGHECHACTQRERDQLEPGL